MLVFLLTRPSRDVTSFLCKTDCPVKFLLTRPSRDVTKFYRKNEADVMISTHTSLAGRDAMLEAYDNGEFDFYSHVPRGT